MGRKGARRRIAENVYADGSGWAIVARAGHLRTEKRYPRGSSIREMRSWQRDEAAELRKLLGTPLADTRRTLREDVAEYATLKTMASLETRLCDLRTWLETFGHRRRRTLKTPELDRQLRHWRQVDGLAASTVNHRRNALADLFTVLDGEDASNPVKGCIWFKRPTAVPKGIDRGRIARVLAAMNPDRKTRWRLTLMHWAGMRPSQMGRLRGPDDFYLDDRAFELEVAGVLRRVPAVLVPLRKGRRPDHDAALARG